MEVSKVASWGTKEDRPERDEMRSRLIGHDFMAEYREAEGGKKKHEDKWVVRPGSERTPYPNSDGCGAVPVRSRTSTGRPTPRSRETCSSRRRPRVT